MRGGTRPRRLVPNHMPIRIGTVQAAEIVALAQPMLPAWPIAVVSTIAEISTYIEEYCTKREPVISRDSK